MAQASGTVTRQGHGHVSGAIVASQGELYVAGKVGYIALHISLANLWGRGEVGRTRAVFAPSGLLDRAGLAGLAVGLPGGFPGLGGPFAGRCGHVAEPLPDAVCAVCPAPSRALCGPDMLGPCWRRRRA